MEILMYLYSLYLKEGCECSENKEEAIRYCKVAADNGNSDGIEEAIQIL